ncbi:MAG: molecular chaperone DnaK [Candidatus Sumerlaeia bacterium]
MTKVLGIDLGTTNSCVAVMEGGQPQVIPNLLGQRVTPSVVAFLPDGQQVVGAIARRQAAAMPHRTIYSIKRFMGMRYSEVQAEISHVAYRIACGENNHPQVEIDGQRFTPEEISARILAHLRQAAETHLGEEIRRAVVTVPAYFNDDQRKATRQAGKIAGLDVMRIINEPTAAALAYGLDKADRQTIAVFDFGGGTFDISILHIGDGVFEVKSTAGDTHLGGDDIDNLIIEWLVEQFRSETGINLRNQPAAVQRLKEEAERVKCELSSLPEASVSLPFIAADESGPKHLQASLTRATLERMIEPLVRRTIEICGQAVQDAGMQVGDINNVILVGGSTRIPMVRSMVRNFFGREPYTEINPDEVVAMGAAIQGAVLTGDVQDMLLLDVTPLSLGIAANNGLFVKFIERNTTIPTSHKRVFTTAEDNQTSVHIHVLQGERQLAKDNRTLARFNLFGIPPAPRRVAKIEVTFDIDADGILHVSATDKGTGRSQQIRIEGSSQLTEQEVNEYLAAAAEHRKDDERIAQLTLARAQAEDIIQRTQETIERFEDRLTRRERAEMEDCLDSLHASLSAEDLPAIMSAIERISGVWSRIQQRLIEVVGEHPAGGSQKP